MKKIVLFLFICSCYNISFSQDSLVVLDSSIGDTIYQSEKMDYLLFPEVADTAYTFGQVFYKNASYYLHTHHNGKVVVSKIGSSAIQESRMNIRILNAYKKKQKGSDVMQVQEKDNKKAPNTDYMTPEMKQKLISDTKRHINLRNEADYNMLRGQDKENFINNGGHFEIPLKKKK